MTRKRLVIVVVAGVYFGVLAALTFVPVSASVSRSGWIWSFALFVPVGVLLVLLMGTRRWWAAWGFGVLGAAWIEAAQTVWVPDCASIADLVAGSIGVTVGVAATVVILVGARKSMRSHDALRMMSQSGNREIPQD